MSTANTKPRTFDWFTWVIVIATIWNTVFSILLDEFYYFFMGIVHGIGFVMVVLFAAAASREPRNTSVPEETTTEET